jgi:hypothetical protein
MIKVVMRSPCPVGGEVETKRRQIDEPRAIAKDGDLFEGRLTSDDLEVAADAVRFVGTCVELLQCCDDLWKLHFA